MRCGEDPAVLLHLIGAEQLGAQRRFALCQNALDLCAVVRSRSNPPNDPDKAAEQCACDQFEGAFPGAWVLRINQRKAPRTTPE
jgi:hypothetical protein